MTNHNAVYRRALEYYREEYPQDRCADDVLICLNPPDLYEDHKRLAEENETLKEELAHVKAVLETVRTSYANEVKDWQINVANLKRERTRMVSKIKNGFNVNCLDTAIEMYHRMNSANIRLQRKLGFTGQDWVVPNTKEETMPSVEEMKDKGILQ